MNRYDLQRLARLRVREARVLLENGHFAGAYYLLGYAVECAFKACIAKRIKRYDFPDRKLINDSYTHDLEKLLSVAELRVELQQEIRRNPALEAQWSIVKEWSEQSRYELGISEAEARGLYSAVTSGRYGVLAWLRKWW
jgi:HEPN domain-containing protein